MATAPAGTRSTGPSRAGRAPREVVETIVLVVVIFVAVRAVVLNVKVDGPSMVPSLRDHEMPPANRNVHLHFDRNAMLGLLAGGGPGGRGYRLSLPSARAW